MYYEESFHNERLWFRTTPTGDWRPAGVEICNRRIKEMVEQIEEWK